MSEQNIVNQLANKDQERLHGYKDLLDFYNGLQWPGRERWGEKRLTFNYAKIFIDKITSYLMSGIGFTVDAIEDTPEARAKAEQAEKTLYQVYESNHLEQLDFETEIDCAILGDGCYKVIWDPDTKEIKVTAPDIRGIYAWWVGDDVSRIWRVASKYTLSAEESLRDFFHNIKPNGQSGTIIELWTDQTFELYLDNIITGE